MVPIAIISGDFVSLSLSEWQWNRSIQIETFNYKQIDFLNLPKLIQWWTWHRTECVALWSAKGKLKKASRWADLSSGELWKTHAKKKRAYTRRRDEAKHETTRKIRLSSSMCKPFIIFGSYTLYFVFVEPTVWILPRFLLKRQKERCDCACIASKLWNHWLPLSMAGDGSQSESINSSPVTAQRPMFYIIFQFYSIWR